MICAPQLVCRRGLTVHTSSWQGDGAEVRSAQEVLQAVPALRLLDNHAAVLDDVAQHMQQKPKLPPVQDPQLPDLQSVAADVVAILHLVSEVREGRRGGLCLGTAEVCFELHIWSLCLLVMVGAQIGHC